MPAEFCSRMTDGECREAVVFISHTLSEPVLSRFRQLERETAPEKDVFFAYDTTGVNAASRQTTRQLVGDGLRTFEVSQIVDTAYPDPWADSGEKSIVPGNIDLLFIYFSKIEPSYSRYWFIEYDVAYTGPWSEVFQRFKQSTADLLGTTLTPYEHRPNWYWWPSFDPASELDRSKWVRGFFPIVRLSTDAIELLDEGYRAGWTGHYEAVMPTLLHTKGLEVEDIGGTGYFVKSKNRNRFYTNTPDHPTLAPGSFVYRPARPEPGRQSGTLWHPIKPNAGRLIGNIRLMKHRILKRLGF